MNSTSRNDLDATACDSSPGTHPTGHFPRTTHPRIRSLQRGEGWGSCYADEVMR